MKRFISLMLCCVLTCMLFVCSVSAADVKVAFSDDGTSVILTVPFGKNNAYAEVTGKLFNPNKSYGDILADGSNLTEVFASIVQTTADGDGVATFTFEIVGEAGLYNAEFSTRKTAKNPLTKGFLFAPLNAVNAKFAELCALPYSDAEDADNTASVAKIAEQFEPVAEGLSGADILGLSSAEPEITIYNAMDPADKDAVCELMLYEFSAMECDPEAGVYPAKSDATAVFKKSMLLNDLMNETDLEAVKATMQANADILGLNDAECYTNLFLPKLESSLEKDAEIIEEALTTFLAGDWSAKDICIFKDAFSECMFMSAIRQNASDGEVGVIMDAVPGYVEQIGIENYDDATNKSDIWAEAASTKTLEAFVKAVKDTISTEPGQTIKPSSPSSPSRDNGTGRGNGKVSGVSNVIAPTPVELAVFGDLGSVSWAEEAILGLAEKNILNGKEAGKFFPGDDMKREEFAKVLVLAFGLSGESDASFTDVESSAWYYEYVMAANASGIINGQGETFGVGGSLTRQDMAVMIGRVLESRMELPLVEEPTFADSADISDYAKKYVACLLELGFVSGVGDNNFEPLRSVTRAEVAKVIYSVMKEVAAL